MNLHETLANLNERLDSSSRASTSYHAPLRQSGRTCQPCQRQSKALARSSQHQPAQTISLNDPASKRSGFTGLDVTEGGVKNATVRYDLPSPPVAVRNLMEQAQLANLCTVMSRMHHRRAGYPFGTLVNFATDGAGHPIFCLSPLAVLTRNILEDPRCSLVVQLPGWNGLGNARVTLFGDVYQLPPELLPAAKEIFLQKQAATSKERWVSNNFLFFRMHTISDVFFVGGFGTVQWIDVKEYGRVKPDQIVLCAPLRTLEVLNEEYQEQLKHALASPATGLPADDAAFISIDRRGADVRVRHGTEYCIERIAFAQPVHSLEEAVAAAGLALQQRHPELGPPREAATHV